MSPKAALPSRESRISRFMLAIVLAAVALSGYFTVTLPGVSQPRILMAVLCAGWIAMLANTLRAMAPSR